MYVSAKVGDNLPAGSVIKARVPTGEFWLRTRRAAIRSCRACSGSAGRKTGTETPRERCIYIHGTAEERLIGRRASYGCIRMRSKDVIALYTRVHIGTPVTIADKPLSDFIPPEEETLLSRPY
jgi:lipoprotein-anchoring transpeptidase ErfK/SrfK